MRNKLRKFARRSAWDQANRISTLYYEIKGVLLYRFVFRRFGRRSYIRKPLLIANPRYIDIGERVTVQTGIRLEAIMSNPNRIPSLRIGDGTNIEQNVHIVCHSRVNIGANVSITGHCSVVDITHDFSSVTDNTKIGHRIRDDDSYVEIGDGSFIGFGTSILPNVRIGKNVIIGCNSVVTHDIPDYSVAAGSPAIVIKRYDFSAATWVSIKETIQPNN